ncbi:hypothetical protein MY10362_009853 [Beauveria mimosiformis]
MSAAPPSDTSPEDVINTVNQMRQEKGPEEGQPLSYMPSVNQDGVSTAAGYENHSQEIFYLLEYLRKETENHKKEVEALQEELDSVKRVTKQLKDADNSLKKTTTESLESVQDQLSLLLNTCPVPEDDPFAYPPLPSA